MADSLGQLAAQKQQELSEVQGLRILSLQALVEERDGELAAVKSKFQKLKDDFKYNLKLLSERDRELEQYDTSFSAMKVALYSREAELSDLKIKIDSLEDRAEREMVTRDKMKKNYEQLLQQRLIELEQYKSSKEDEVSELRVEMVNNKGAMEKQLIETQEEARLQHHELSSGFDELLRKREHEYRMTTDEMRRKVLAYELQVKLLTKEIEHTNAVKDNATKEVKQIEDGQSDLQMSLKQREWEIQDLNATHGAYVTELQEKLARSEQALQRTKDDYCKRYEEYEKKVNAQDITISRLQAASKEKEDDLAREVKQLRSELDESHSQQLQMQSRLNDKQMDLKATAVRFRADLNDACRQWEGQLTAVMKENQNLKKEISNKQTDKTKLMSELSQRQHDIERYKNELQAHIERETDLEQGKVQMDLDWQRRLEEAERKYYERSEDLIVSLTKARDEALAQVKVLQRDMEHKESLNLVLTTDRSSYINPSHTNVQEGISSATQGRVTELEVQNKSLREAVHSMRQEMEGMISQIPDNATNHRQHTASLDNDQPIKMDSVKTPDESSKTQVNYGDNMIMKSHLKKLNNEISGLRQEKVELTALLRKQQTKLQYMEEFVDKANQEPQMKQIEVDQLNYALGAATRRHEVEVSSLRQRLADVELQATEAKKEADEYHHACLESNMESGALRTQVSQLKLQLAEHRPTINFGAQELVIQQLQDEIQRLQKMMKTGGNLETEHIKAGDAHLKSMLRQAVNRISQLTKEKQQLIEVGNRLRAQLNKNGLRSPSPPHRQLSDSGQQSHTKTSLGQKIENKLKHLEQLQYDVTKKELSQSARRVPPPVNDTSDDASDDTEEELPQRSILKKTRESQNPPSLNSTANTATGETEGYAGGLERYPSGLEGYPTGHHANHVNNKMCVVDGETSAMWKSHNPTLHATGFSVSSVGAESIQEIWKMLDEGTSPRPPAKQHDMSLEGTSEFLPSRDSTKTSPLTVHGNQPVLTTKQNTHVAYSPCTSGRVLTAKKKKQVIRNYNVRDDATARR